MAVKTFTTGEVLTAADTNTYLANAGLVYITSVTIGSNVATVTVSNCFSSTYDHYRIILSNSVCNLNDYSFTFTLNNSTGSTYNYMAYYSDFAGVTRGPTSWQNSPNGLYLGFSSTTNTSFISDIMNPYQASYTRATHLSTGNAYGTMGASLDKNAVSHTGFTVKSDDPAPRLTGGTITVYGYRKA